MVYKTGNSKILLLFLLFYETFFLNIRNAKNSKGLGWVKALNTCENLTSSISFLSSFCTFGLCRDRLDLFAPRTQRNTHSSFPVTQFYLTPNRNVTEIATEWGWFQSKMENIVDQLLFPCHISSWCIWNRKYLKSQHGEGLQSCVLEIKILSRCNVYYTTKRLIFY